MALNFKKFAAEGTHFVNDLARELGYPKDTVRAGRVLKSIMHALRNQLTVEESVQLLAQLPMFLKAVYVESWTLHKPSKKAKHLDDFYKEIRAINQLTAENDFPNDDSIDNALSVVFMALRKHISLGELEDIKAVLPKELKPILNSVTMI